MTSRTMRRTGLVAGIAAATVALAACGSGDPAADGGSVNLRAAWYGGEARHDMYNEVLDQFEAEHDGVTIGREGAEWNAYWERIGTQTVAGDAPDLLHFTDMQLREFAENGVLLDLAPYIESGALDVSDFDETLLASGEVDGAIYALPTGMLALSSIINVDMMDEAGVELPAEGEMWTWEEMAENGRTAAANLGDGRWFTQDMAGATRPFRAFLLARGLDLFNLDTDPVTLGFEESDLVDWLTYWEELRKDGVAPPASFTSEQDGLPFEDMAFSQDVVGIQLHTSNSLTNHAPYAEGEMVLRPIPRGDEGANGDYAFSVMMAVSSNSSHPDEAVELLSYFLTDPEVAPIYRNEFGPSASQSMREAISEDLDPEEMQVAEYSEAMLEQGLHTTSAWPPGGVLLNDGLLARANQQVAFGEASAEEAVAAFFSEAESALS